MVVVVAAGAAVMTAAMVSGCEGDAGDGEELMSVTIT